MLSTISYRAVKVSAIALALTLAGFGVASAKTTPASAVKGCAHAGAPVINVTQKITNDADSGQAGNYWAYDTVNRQIQVYDNGDGTYCAQVTYQGKFDSQAGQTSPGATGTLTGKEDGTMSGGYQGEISGSLLATPAWPTHGSVGTTDYACDLSGNCPGAVNWLGQYFTSGYSFSYDNWGWTYSYKNCNWVNSQDGNSGDILCSVSHAGGNGGGGNSGGGGVPGSN